LKFFIKKFYISAGFDAAQGTPAHIGGFHVTPAGYAQMTKLLLAAIPTTPFAVVLEGGYDLPSLSACATAVLVEQLQEMISAYQTSLFKEDELYLMPAKNPKINTEDRVHPHCQKVIEEIVSFHAQQGWPVSMSFATLTKFEIKIEEK